ncbi:MAG: sodium-dependent transporter [Spirochaetes bacterium]|nr:MAG: sodium-dependent transporter [Spirochaetota bacterium]
MEERERWDKRIEFILAAIGAAVGLGNIWRFPYMVYQNGGGAFLIPYFVALFTAGIPLMILEYTLGTRMQGGAPQAFAKISKKFEWVGWLSIVLVFFIATYYTVIMAWSFDYLWFSIKLKWGHDTANFFYKDFLQLSGSPSVLGSIRWPVIIGLVLAWLAIFLCIFKGPKATGKVVYFTVLTPIVLLIIMVIRGLTLPNAIEGIKYYLTPNFKKLLEPRVWLAAYGQVFFSLSLAMGTLIAYSSYLPKDSDTNNNAFITSLADAGIAFFAGFAVFSVLGYLAMAMNTEVPKVVSSGFGLAFITYPTAINHLPAAPLFGVFFFLLLLTLAIDSAFSEIEGIAAGFMDKWKIKRVPLLLAIIIPAFLIGLIYTTKGGFYWIDVVDYFVCTFGLTLVGFLETVIVGYYYGADKMREYSNSTSDFAIGRWWNICIKYITPIILVISFFSSIYSILKKPYGDYPLWVTIVGFGIFIFSIIIAFVLQAIKGKEE